MSARRDRIVIGTTPLRYDFDTARDAVTTYNRHTNLISSPALRLLAADIVNGPLKNGDLDAVVVFLTHGYRYLAGYEQLSEREVGKLLTHYLKPGDVGGGGIRDFHVPICMALVAAGIIAEDIPTKGADEEEPNAANRPTLRPLHSRVSEQSEG